MIGCNDNSDNNDPTPTPPPQAHITSRTEPDPVPFSGNDASGTHKWNFNLIVEETGGVGATILDWTYEMFKNDNTSIGAGSFTVNDFVTGFKDCDPHTEKINPNSKICSKSFSASSKDNEAGWYIIMKMTFRDDNNNTIPVECKITLLPVS